jgi:hypothetical protein
MRVFVLRIVAAKNSRKRRAAWSPASAITAGTISALGAAATVLEADFGTSWCMGNSVT